MAAPGGGAKTSVSNHFARRAISSVLNTCTVGTAQDSTVVARLENHQQAGASRPWAQTVSAFQGIMTRARHVGIGSNPRDKKIPAQLKKKSKTRGLKQALTALVIA